MNVHEIYPVQTLSKVCPNVLVKCIQELLDILNDAHVVGVNQKVPSFYVMWKQHFFPDHDQEVVQCLQNEVLVLL